MKDNTLILLLAEGILGLYTLLPWADPVSRAAALGALVGIVGGHLNGGRASLTAST